MSSKQNILFIINPVSGTSNKKDLPKLIKKLIKHDKFLTSIQYTQYAGHGKEIASIELKQQDVIVAVGGDGTINEIGSALVGTNCALGIIPLGSGNGLARSLNIPLNTKTAIKHLNKAVKNKIDVCYLNDTPFFCTAGIGFDANVAHRFNNLPSRGLATYIKSVFQEIKNHLELKILISFEGKQLEKIISSITFANAQQYGNNFYIAPLADIQDGITDICIISKLSFFKIIPLSFRLVTQSIHKSSFYEHLSTPSDIRIEILNSRSPISIHIDGEARFIQESHITIRNSQQQLTMFC